MSKLRRAQSIYANVRTSAITPDLSRQDAIIIKIAPDTKVERALYRMLLQERNENKQLREALSRARNRLIEWQAKRKIGRVGRKFKPSHSDTPVSKG